MKTFTYSQKKWVMTATLLAVLGFNVSFNSHTNDGIATADFASTVTEGVVQGKIYTAAGVVPVKYIDNGEDKVLAIVPKKMTEGKVCDSCGYDSIPLNVKNKQDIDVLNVELMKSISKKSETPVAEKVEDKKESEAQGEEGEKDLKKDFFADIEKCDSKEKTSDLLSCRTSKFIKIIRSNTKDIEKEDAYSYYKENIESLLASQVAESRRIINRQRRSAVMPGQWSPFAESDDFQESPAEMRDDALKSMRELLSGIPAKFENIRRRLVLAQTEIIKIEAQELQQTFVQSRDTKNPSLGNYLFNEGLYRKNDLESLLETSLVQTQLGLDSAKRVDLNENLRSQYLDYFSEFTRKMYTGINTDIYNFMGSGNQNTTLPGVNLDPRLGSPIRGGGGSIGGGIPAISSRTGMSLNSNLQTDQIPAQIRNGSPLVIPTENVGVSFGQMVPASAESLRMRSEIQSRFPRQ